MKLPTLLQILSCTLLATSLHTLAAERDFYVGTYTKKEGSKGIYHFRLDTDSGKISGGELAAEAKNPSFLALHPSGKYLYAANEIGGSGGVSAFAVEADGKLKLLDQQPAGGAGTCHVSVDAAGRYVFVANYDAGSIAAFPIQPDGSLGKATATVQHKGASVNAQRQKEPHAHSIYADPKGRLVYACDLGTDKVYAYRLDLEKGTLTPDETATTTIAPGSGPRHLAFHPDGRFAYVINEMANTVTALQRDETSGALTVFQTVSALPAGSSAKSSTAEIFLHPNGKFLYGSNRGDDSIAVFAIAADGKLTPVAHTPTQGKNPRNFALDPEGKFLLAANQDSDSIVVFKVDPATGKLTAAGQSVKVSSPVSIQFVPIQ